MFRVLQNISLSFLKNNSKRNISTDIPLRNENLMMQTSAKIVNGGARTHTYMWKIGTGAAYSSASRTVANQLDIRFHPLNFGQTQMADGSKKFYPLHPCFLELNGREFPTLLTFHPDNERRDDSGNFLYLIGMDVLLQGISIDLCNPSNPTFVFDDDIKALTIPGSHEKAYTACLNNLSDPSATLWTYDEFIQNKLGRMNLLGLNQSLTASEMAKLQRLGSTKSMDSHPKIGIPIGLTSTMHDHRFTKDFKLMKEMDNAIFID